MSEMQRIYMPSRPLIPGGERYGLLSNFDPGTRTLTAGTSLAPHFRTLPVDIVFDKDVAVTLRDGTVTYVDVLRPIAREKVPVIVAFSPYGKGQGTSQSAMGVFGMVGLDNSIVSGLQKFEGPDPAYWCAQGYAICNPDIRGVAESEGDSVLWDRQEGRDAYDLIEWLGVQEWSNGRVAMSGTSYLAASQWFTAAEQPPHLAAINPWEGMSDTYRDLVMRGGMPDSGFANQLRDFSFWGHGQKEDIIAEAEHYPLINELWANKVPEYERITVPAYVVPATRTRLTPRARSAPGVGSRRATSGSASTTVRSGQTTMMKRIERTCVAFSTTSSRTSTTAGSERRASAIPYLTCTGATRSPSVRTYFRRRKSYLQSFS